MSALAEATANPSKDTTVARVDELHDKDEVILFGHIVVLVGDPAEQPGFEGAMRVCIRRVDQPDVEPVPTLLPPDWHLVVTKGPRIGRRRCMFCPTVIVYETMVGRGGGGSICGPCSNGRR